MVQPYGSPPPGSAHGTERVIWVDHQHVVVLRHAPDGPPKIDVLERLPLESESEFDARAAIYVGSRSAR